MKNKLCNKELCSGCMACMNVCPKNAIKMNTDSKMLEHLYPVIDENKCINCNMCNKTCPVINPVEFNYPKKCYVAFSENNVDRVKSSSGGISYILLSNFIKNGGIVYAASLINEYGLEFKRYSKSNFNELEETRGSKYVHSHINYVYKQIIKDLSDNKVCFIGTPCQVAGLKNIIKKEVDNLYTIDIVCHGVPSQKFLFEEILSHINLNDFKTVTFRENNDAFFNIYDKNDNKVYSEKRENNNYYYGFMQGLFFRKSCFNCIYKKNERCSDITLGDFIGIDKHNKHKVSNGTSLVLINTDKGFNFYSANLDGIYCEEENIKFALNNNGPLHIVPNESFKRKIFCWLYNFIKNYNISVKLINLYHNKKRK